MVWLWSEHPAGQGARLRAREKPDGHWGVIIRGPRQKGIHKGSQGSLVVLQGSQAVVAHECLTGVGQRLPVLLASARSSAVCLQL